MIRVFTLKCGTLYQLQPQQQRNKETKTNTNEILLPSNPCDGAWRCVCAIRRRRPHTHYTLTTLLGIHLIYNRVIRLLRCRRAQWVSGELASSRHNDCKLIYDKNQGKYRIEEETRSERARASNQIPAARSFRVFT